MAYRMFSPSYYLSQCLRIVYLAPMEKTMRKAKDKYIFPASSYVLNW